MKTPSGDQSAPPSKSAYDLDDDLDKDLNGDTLREECGVFGIFGHPEAAAITALGLHALQHRGQEAAGIVSFVGSGGIQVLRTRGDSRSGPAVGIQVLQARGTRAPRKRSKLAARRTGRSRR